MAVYKPTYCYPHLSAIDARVVANNLEADAVAPAKFIGCRVDTSNTDVTGYSVRLLDDVGNQLITNGDVYISPIEELQSSSMASVNEGGNINTGINGSILQIPFFQNNDKKLISSMNAIYYKPRFAVQHMILGEKMSASLNYESHINATEKTAYWEFAQDGDYLTFDWSHKPEGFSDNQIVLDGDTVMLGDTVLIAVAANQTDAAAAGSAECSKSGLWVVSQKYDDTLDTYELVLRRASSVGYPNIENGKLVVVTNGDVLHNCVFQYGESGNDKWFAPQNPNELWCDCNGEPIKDFLPDGRSIRWEITLYQGDYSASSEPGAPYISYSSLDERWLDSVVNSGTILGSTPERIQIASANPAELDEYDSIELPSGDGVDIVLQGKYIGIGYDISDIWGGTRVYVQTYDAVYGHVYPEREQLDTTAVSQSNTCQFFKHSNDPTQILDGDIVDIGINANVVLHVNTPGPGESVNVVRIAIDPSVVANYNMVSGNQILLTGQTSPEENGVYEYYYDDTGYEIGGITYHDFLRRAASYKTWAPYIGKIIYCRTGDWNGRNIESLAPAGTYTLWNPQSVDSGSSALLFTPEIPILLFPKKIRQQGSFNLYCSDHFAPAGNPMTLSIDTIDGQNLAVGDLVLFKDGHSRIVTAVTAGTTTFKNSDIRDVETDEYIYFLSGQSFGKRVFKWGDSFPYIDASHPSWDLHTAVILKNSNSITFVSPYSGMKPGMKLKLSDGHKVIYDSGQRSQGLPYSPRYETIGYQSDPDTIVSAWIPVLSYNDKLHFVEHPPLACDSIGVTLYNDGTAGLASYGPDDSFPWKYEVRTNFATSVESSFSLFEEPYLRLYRDGYAYVGLGVGEFYDFDVVGDMGFPYDDFYVQAPLAGEPEERFGFHYMVDQTTIATRSVHLSADYQRFNDLSWQSYRWILVNADGDIIQDTGDRYDGSIEATFFGLSGDADTPKAYYAVLYVTDTANDVLRYVIKLKVGVDIRSNLVLPFSATFDCQTHSILLSYHDISHILPTYKNGYDYVVYDSSYQGEGSPWDGGISYMNDSMVITGEYGRLSRIVDYSLGSTMTQADAIAPRQSNAIAYGVPYAVSFKQPGSSIAPLDEADPLYVDGDSVYLATEVSLGDDYCGEFFSFCIEGEDSNNSPSPQYNSAGAWDSVPSGYMRISLSIPDVFDGGSVAADRMRVRIKIEKNDGGEAEPFSDYIQYDDDGTPVYYEWGEYSAPTDQRYYLQPAAVMSSSVLSDPGSEFLELDTIPLSLGGSPLDLAPFLRNTRGGYCCFFDKPLGNLNLVSGSDIDPESGEGTEGATATNPFSRSAGAPSYWVENRYPVKLLTDSDKKFAFADDVAHLVNAFDPDPQSDYPELQSWPTAADEELAYWNESPNPSGGLSSRSAYAACWEHLVPSTDATVARVVAIDRHPGSLSRLSFRFVARIDDPTTFYDDFGEEDGNDEPLLSHSWDYDAIDERYTLRFYHDDVPDTTIASFEFSVIHVDE